MGLDVFKFRNKPYLYNEVIRALSKAYYVHSTFSSYDLKVYSITFPALKLFGS